MMTLSGMYLRQDNDAAPSLLDIATGLSRMPRFGGQTLDPWHVTDHLLSGAVLLKRGGARANTILHWLLHDAHEAFTGDIPTHFKTPDTKALQERVDERIYRSLKREAPNVFHRAIIKNVDREMLLAEAYHVTPAATYRRIVEELDGQEASSHGKSAVKSVHVRALTSEQSAHEWLLSVGAMIIATEIV